MHTIELRISECNPLDGVRVWVEDNAGNEIDTIEVAYPYRKGHTTYEWYSFLDYYSWKEDADCDHVYWYETDETDMTV